MLAVINDNRAMLISILIIGSGELLFKENNK